MSVYSWLRDWRKLLKILNYCKLQKYENPPITTTEGLTHRGSSSIYLNHDEFNYSPMAASHVFCFLDCLRKLQEPHNNSLGSYSRHLQPGIWHSFVLQKEQATKATAKTTSNIGYSDALPRMAETINVGTL